MFKCNILDPVNLKSGLLGLASEDCQNKHVSGQVIKNVRTTMF